MTGAFFASTGTIISPRINYNYQEKGWDQGKGTWLILKKLKKLNHYSSFSKILSAGLRVGFVSGPPMLINQIQLDGQASSLHSSGISQAITGGDVIHYDHPLWI